MFLTLPLHKAARERPEATAYVDSHRRLSHRDFLTRVSRLAAALKGLGLQPGDRVALLGGNSVRYLETAYACWWAGGVIAPMNIRWSVPELGYGLSDSGAKILMVDGGYAGLIPELRRIAPTLDHVIHAGEEIAPEGFLDHEGLLQAAAETPDLCSGGDELAAILYTGGTTGMPKGVMLSHANMAFNALAVLISDPRAGSPVVLHSAPFFHVGGFSLVLQASLRGATGVMLPAFEPAEVLAAIEREKISEIFVVPTMLKFLLEHPDFARRDTRSVRTVIYGAAPMDPALLDRAMLALPGASFVQAYGQTEAGPVLTVLPSFSHTQDGRYGGKLRSAGVPVATAEVRILGSDGGDLPTGQVGEICARGPTVMRGYWNKPEQTAEALKDGWLRTGDGGYFDEDGYLFVVDRFKDMIITGGENVFSTEVENAMLQHPAVSQCAVIGVPDETWGERVMAFVVLRPGMEATAETLIAHARTLIAGFKCPRVIEFRDSLPVSAAGKLLKYVLREPYKRPAATPKS